MCSHRPACPDALSSSARSARIVGMHVEQGWCQLCNGLILFEDGGTLLPDGRVGDQVPAAPLFQVPLPRAV